MAKRIHFALILIATCCASVGFAQIKEITNEEYYTPLRAALQKAVKLNRCVQSATLRYNGGKTDIEEWDYEYALPDKDRLVHTETVDDKVQRTEQIDIGKIKYCKKDDGPWEIPKGYCIAGSGNGGPPNIISTKYTIEKVDLPTRHITIFRETITYKNIYSPNKETEGNSFWYSNYWLDENGLIIREETKIGLVKGETLNRKTITSYTYDPKHQDRGSDEVADAGWSDGCVETSERAGY